jgi:hypothetical protein
MFSESFFRVDRCFGYSTSPRFSEIISRSSQLPHLRIDLPAVLFRVVQCGPWLEAPQILVRGRPVGGRFQLALPDYGQGATM